MSLAIDVDTVVGVLIDGSWYEVIPETFSLDSYEYLWSGRSKRLVASLDKDEDPVVLHGGGQSGVCANGFSFKTIHGNLIAGPLTAISAVRYVQPQIN